ncbi:RB8NL protein, partial [Todus mexicanus]|nr:RB8NL protein [Todus mexicanus]
DKTKHPGATSRESSSTPSSPLALLSPVSRNISTEKSTHRGAEEAHHDVPSLELGEGPPQPGVPSRTAHLDFPPLLQASQRISNQLHGTIALVRPGSRPCLLEKSPSGASVSPPARKTPLPPEREHSPSLEAYLAASKPESPKLAPSYENLKLSARREQLCLLHKHLSLHQLGLASNCASADRDGGSFSSHLLRAKEAESRTRSRDGWEDRAALLKLPAAMVYVRDQHLEEKLHLLKQRERLQHFLLQQCQPGRRLEGDPKPPPEERPLSPWPSIMRECKEEKSCLEEAADGKEEKELWLSQASSELRGKVKAARDDGADVPLDLSDSGRGRETSWHSRRESQGAGSPRLSPRESPAVPRGPCGRCGMERDDLSFHYRWPNAAQALPGAEGEEEEDAAALTLSQAHPTNNSTLRDPEALPESGLRLAGSAQKGEAGKKPRAKVTLAKARAQDDGDAESGKQESDEGDTTDSEVAAPYEDDTLQEAQADGKYFCTKDKAQALQKKRKRGQDPCTKGAKKPVRGRKKVKVEQCPAGITQEPENCSASHNDSSEES